MEEREWLKKSVQGILRAKSWKSDTKAVAQRLIASSFFFEKASTDVVESSIEGKSHERERNAHN